MDDCIFCKIVKGEIPAAKVYEDDQILAFLDVSPVTIGHTLVITKEHFDNILFVPKDILAKAISFAQKIAQAQTNILGAKGINILNNTGIVAGQSVNHFHIHVIPRYKVDEGFKLEFEHKQIESISLPALAKNIKDAIK